MLKKIMPNVFYSWVPNLTGSINFQFLSDNINQEDFTYPISQTYIDKSPKAKCFLLQGWLFSDGTIDSKKGLKRDIIVKITEKNDKLFGEYYEFLPERYLYIEDKSKKNILEDFQKTIINNLSIPKDSINHLINKIKPDLSATFVLNLNGNIKIRFNENRHDGYFENNIALITYRAIKYILHKDIFHAEEEDTIINIYKDCNCHDKISQNMLRYIKSYERAIKDSIKNDPKNTYIKEKSYQHLLIKAEGISLYLKSFNIIHNLDNSTSELANNIILSIKYMLKDQEINFINIKDKKEVKAYAVILIISSSILITGWVATSHKEYSPEILLLLPVPILLSFFVFYDSFFKKKIYKYFNNKAWDNPEKFINEKLTYSENLIYKNRKQQGIYVTLAIFIIYVGYKTLI